MNVLSLLLLIKVGSFVSITSFNLGNRKNIFSFCVIDKTNHFLNIFLTYWYLPLCIGDYFIKKLKIELQRSYNTFCLSLIFYYYLNKYMLWLSINWDLNHLFYKIQTLYINVRPVSINQKLKVISKKEIFKFGFTKTERVILKFKLNWWSILIVHGHHNLFWNSLNSLHNFPSQLVIMVHVYKYNDYYSDCHELTTNKPTHD